MPDFLTLENRSPTSIIIAMGGVIVICIGVIAGLILTGQSQDPRQEAATASGTVEIAMSPSTHTLRSGESTTITVSLNTKGVAISGVAARVTYPITSGNANILVASNPTPLINQNDDTWSCQVASTRVLADRVNIDLGCLYISDDGYTNQAATPLHSFTVTAGATTATTPITLTFENNYTVVTPKSGTEDIAAIPTTNSVITVQASGTTTSPTPRATNTPTPSPTSVAATPTPTPLAGLAACNQTCVANRDCQANLSCISGRCRANRCANDTTCQCRDLDVAGQTNTSTLPESGSVTITGILIGVGLLYVLAGTSLFAYVLSGRKD